MTPTNPALPGNQRADSYSFAQVLARKGLNKRHVVEADGIEALVGAMNGYPKSYRIQWRGCATITDLCESEAVCSEMGKRGAVSVIMNAYER
jgi:hypothetical protein